MYMKYHLTRTYSFAPQRHVTETAPWQQACRNLTSNLLFLSFEADDTSLDQAKRAAARETFQLMDGTHSLFMGLLTDFMTLAWGLAQWVQRTRLDGAIIPRKCRQHLHLLDITFLDAGVLTPAASGTFTHMVIEQMRQKPMFFQGDKCQILGS